MPGPIQGQLAPIERELIMATILGAPKKPKVALEVGTWLGGGSTIHILRALEENNEGHLWGVEADESIYKQMIANLQAAAPEALARFTPLFGFSQNVIPKWLAEKGPEFQIDLAFLDGGDNPMEQITEFRMIDRHLPVGGVLMTHDAKLRKGKWLVPYVSRLDNWESKLHDVSAEGLFYARKTAVNPSPASLRGARLHLFRMRLEPAELAAALLPAKVCGIVLRLLPRHVSLRLGQGRI
jgi:predicted O-methyltransferase YrrM